MQHVSFGNSTQLPAMLSARNIPMQPRCQSNYSITSVSPEIRGEGVSIIICSIKGLSFGSRGYTTGPGCSKLRTSLVNVSLKFQTLISEIRRYFLWKNCSFSQFFNKKYQCILVIKL